MFRVLLQEGCHASSASVSLFPPLCGVTVYVARVRCHPWEEVFSVNGLGPRCFNWCLGNCTRQVKAPVKGTGNPVPFAVGPACRWLCSAAIPDASVNSMGNLFVCSFALLSHIKYICEVMLVRELCQGE